MRIVLTGGGRGGHLVPFEPIVDTIRMIYQEKKDELPGWIEKGKMKIYFLGVLDKESKEFFKRLDVKAINIPAAKLRRYPSPRTISDFLFRMPIGLIKSLFYMWLIMPDVMISKGGYGSIPVSLASVFYRVPFVLHESDAVSGLANRINAAWAAVITTGFAATRHEMKYYKNKTIVTGTPVRVGLGRETQADAKKLFGMNENVPLLLIMGGSQGAQQINELVLEVLPSIIEDTSVIHLTGEKNLKQVMKDADELLSTSDFKKRYKAYGFLTDKMGPAMTAADVVVSRAGATSLAELSRLRKAAIVIPLDSAAQDHQRFNAQVYEVAEAVRVISPANLGRTLFNQNIRDLINGEELRKTLGENIARLDHPNAARDIVKIAYKLAEGIVPFQPKSKD